MSRDLEYLIFFLKKLLWGPMKMKFRVLWLRWSWPNVLAYQNFWSTMWHPLVAKFSNMCYFHHFLRVRWKRSPQSTGLPWKIKHWLFCPKFFWESIYMWRGPHFIRGLQNSPWRSQSPSPSPSPESGGLFKNWQNFRK